MIVPLTDDNIWCETLALLPSWDPPAMPAVVLAPHPDDETLGAGALIATLRACGVPVTVVAATDGENAYDIPPDERKKLGCTRETEQRDALALLGVEPSEILRLRLTDSGLHREQTDLTNALRDIVRPGMHLIAPWSGDFHPDHEACARSATTVAREKGLLLTSYFFWTWHRGEVSLLENLPLRRFVPEASALAKKNQALLCHHSQLEHSFFEPILPNRLLGPARWPFEVFFPA